MPHPISQVPDIPLSFFLTFQNTFVFRLLRILYHQRVYCLLVYIQRLRRYSFGNPSQNNSSKQATTCVLLLFLPQLCCWQACGSLRRKPLLIATLSTRVSPPPLLSLCSIILISWKHVPPTQLWERPSPPTGQPVQAQVGRRRMEQH